MFKWLEKILQNFRQALKPVDKVEHRYTGEPVDGRLQLALNDLVTILNELYEIGGEFSATTKVYGLCHRSEAAYKPFNQLLEKYNHITIPYREFASITVGQLLEKMRPQVQIDHGGVSVATGDWATRVLGDKHRYAFVLDIVCNEVAKLATTAKEEIHPQMKLQRLGIDAEHQRELAWNIAGQLMRPYSMVNDVPLSRYAPERTVNDITVLFCELLQMEKDRTERTSPPRGEAQRR